MEGLTECPNPLRTCRIGRLHMSMQVAQDYWATRDKTGHRLRYWFSVQTLKAFDGPETALALIVGRLTFSFAWLPYNAELHGVRSTSERAPD